MARNSGNRPVGGPVLTVGVRVLVRRSAGADLTGEVVEDYAAVTDSGGRGHEWAPVHRWAIVLDDGRLVFADTEDLTIDPGLHRPGPEPVRAHTRPTSGRVTPPADASGAWMRRSAAPCHRPTEHGGPPKGEEFRKAGCPEFRGPLIDHGPQTIDTSLGAVAAD
jgi:hypothetical protein